MIPQFMEAIWEEYAIEDGWVSSLETLCNQLALWEDNPTGFGLWDEYDYWQWECYIEEFLDWLLASIPEWPLGHNSRFGIWSLKKKKF